MEEKSAANELKVSMTKVIQIYVGDRPYMRFSNKGETHAKILENTLNEFNINVNKQSSNYGGSVPEPFLQNVYDLCGAGIAHDWSMNEKKIVFFNSSSAEYGKYPDKEHAEEISKLTGIEFKIE